MKCTDCSLHKSCNSVKLEMATEYQGGLMVIGDYPTKVDDMNETIMASRRDAVTWKVLRDVVKVPDDFIHKAYAIKCSPLDGKVGSAELKKCAVHIKEEIARVDPDAIVVLGDVPLKSVLGISGITKHRGILHELEIEGKTYKVVPTVSPQYLEYNQHMLKHFAEDLYLAYRIAQGEDVKSTSKEPDIKIKKCENLEDVYTLIEKLEQAGRVSFDYETSKVEDNGLGVFDPDFKVTLISASFKVGSAWKIKMDHPESPFTEEEVKYIWTLWRTRVLENCDIDKIAHNLKFEMLVSRLFGCPRIRGRVDDTMLMHHLIDEDAKHGLKEIVMNYFPDDGGYEDEVKKWATKVGWHLVPMDVLSPYGAIDAEKTLRIRDGFELILMEDERLYRLYRNLTMYAIRALFEAEWEGMLIDREALINNINKAKKLLSEQEAKLRAYPQVKKFDQHVRDVTNTAKMIELEEKLLDAETKWTTMWNAKMEAWYEKAAEWKEKGKKGEPVLPKKPSENRINEIKKQINEIKIGILDFSEPINFNSPDQLGALLYEKHGFGYRKVWDRKKRQEVASTDKKVLSELDDKHGFIEALQLYRSVSKIVSTYLEGLYGRLDENSRIHTSFLLHGTETGRLSSRNPNLQNLPNVAKLQDEIAIMVTQMVKSCFVPPEGCYLFQYDYSQAELRLIADYADEETMLEAYLKGQDIHALTASKFLRITIDAFMELESGKKKQWRTNAKAGNFGLIYGMSPEGLVDYAKSNYKVILTVKEAEEWREGFFELYPRLLEYHALYIAKAKKFGYVRTMFGRKRHTPVINSPDEYIRSMDERVAINSPIQGTAGEFTIFAIALLRDRLDKRIRIVNTVHDSIIFYVPYDLVKEAHVIIKETCENLPTQQFFKTGLKRAKMVVDAEYSTTNWKELKEYAA